LEPSKNSLFLRATSCPSFTHTIYRSVNYSCYSKHLIKQTSCLVTNVPGAAPTIAPGAENVGQAQIVPQFSKPFQLEGLFGVADAGAFGHEGDEVPMDADEDGDVFFDAVEGPMEDDM
jgi:hypothetical protein